MKYIGIAVTVIVVAAIAVVGYVYHLFSSVYFS